MDEYNYRVQPNQEIKDKVCKQIHLYFLPLTIISGLFTFLPLLGIPSTIYDSYKEGTEMYVTIIIIVGTLIFSFLISKLFRIPFKRVNKIKRGEFECRYLYCNDIEKDVTIHYDNHRRHRTTSYYGVFYWDGAKARAHYTKDMKVGIQMYVFKVDKEYFAAI